MDIFLSVIQIYVFLATCVPCYWVYDKKLESSADIYRLGMVTTFSKQFTFPESSLCSSYNSFGGRTLESIILKVGSSKTGNSKVRIPGTFLKREATLEIKFQFCNFFQFCKLSDDANFHISL